MWEIRTITEDDADLFRSRLSRGFGSDRDTDAASAERFRAIFDYDRTFAVFDEGDIIGTGAAFSLGLTVPGGIEVPMAGTTVITVQPTHRRRGVLRALMARHLDEVADNGEPLAGLWASESSIYGRFGYGVASYRYSAEVDSRALHIHQTPGADSGRVRLIDSDESATVLPPFYEELRLTRPGMLTRSDAWWTHRLLADVESWRGGKSAQRYVLNEEGGEVRGYAIYRQKSKWENFVADGEVDVVEVITADPLAHRSLWAFLTRVDLFPRVEWWNLPVDDPLPASVTDQRRIRRSVADGLWVRLMNVPEAIEARRYESDGRVTVSVTDPTRPATGGTFVIEVEGGQASCTATNVEPDVSLGIDVLGHLYLGGGNALTMARAGRITGDPEAVRALHRVFRTDTAPWCPEVF